MAAVSAFARSEAGVAYAAVCDRWGRDPAAGFADDVAAFYLRAELMLEMAKRTQDEPTEEAEPDFDTKYGVIGD
jgi:hypothetical protein